MAHTFISMVSCSMLVVMARTHVVCSAALDLLNVVMDRAEISLYDVVAECIKIAMKAVECVNALKQIQETSELDTYVEEYEWLNIMPEEYQQRLWEAFINWLRSRLADSRNLSNSDKLKVCFLIDNIQY